MLFTKIFSKFANPGITCIIYIQLCYCMTIINYRPNMLGHYTLVAPGQQPLVIFLRREQNDYNFNLLFYLPTQKGLEFSKCFWKF